MPQIDCRKQNLNCLEESKKKLSACYKIDVFTEKNLILTKYLLFLPSYPSPSWVLTIFFYNIKLWLNLANTFKKKQAIQNKNKYHIARDKCNTTEMY